MNLGKQRLRPTQVRDNYYSTFYSCKMTYTTSECSLRLPSNPRLWQFRIHLPPSLTHYPDLLTLDAFSLTHYTGNTLEILGRQPLAERYEVAVKVISQKGTCTNRHKVGDEWALGSKTPEGICLTAFSALYPTARVLMFGGAHPWDEDSDVTTAACPDADNPVVFELRRLRK